VKRVRHLYDMYVLHAQFFIGIKLLWI
jgi:hypothetical protein